MRLNQLADQLSTKTIGLIAIARALKFTDLPNPHGGTPLSPEQSQQIAAVYQYMRDRQITDPAAGIAQMNTPTAAEGITISIPESVADELCRRYPDGSMSDRILRLLGALQAFEQLYTPYVQPTALGEPLQTTTPHP